MNSLQVGLIAVGVLVVTVLALWSWWQTRRGNDTYKLPKSVRVPETTKGTTVPPVPDHQIRVDVDEFQVLMDDDVKKNARDSTTLVSNAVATETAFADARVTPALTVPSSPAIPVVEARDETVEFVEVKPIEDVEAASGARSLQPPHQGGFDVLPFDDRLHVHAVIYREDGQAVDVAPFLHLAGGNSCYTRLFRQSPWEAVDLSQPTGAAHKVCLAVPIASRSGSVTTAEFESWRTQVAVAAANQNCVAEFEGFAAAEERSAELDRFLVAVDCIPIVYLVRKDGASWSGTRLRGTLEANGFRLQTDGRFAYHEVGSEDVIFHAIDGYERAFTPEALRSESVAAFRLVMEVALLTQPLARFDTYRQTLRALSKLLEADLRDSTGANVGEPEFAEMREQVKTSTEALTGAGITPGSVTAKTLFG
jgi:hypothetical protein